MKQGTAMSETLERRDADAFRPAPGAAANYWVSPDVVVMSGPTDAPAEAIRALRTHVVAQHIEEGRRALSICAAAESSGCSFISVNLAVSLAQIGIKTILIDGNLRKPGLGAFIRPSERGPGLAQCLKSDDSNFGGFIDSEIIPGLSIMYAGDAGASESLSGSRFEALMSFCLRDYEMTIVDTPPANSSSDARRVSTVLGYSLVVARRNRSRVGDLRTLIGQLEGDRAKVIGTVLNEF